MSLTARCPYCFTELDATEPEVRCGQCGTPHHRACFLEHGKCVILGCASRQSTRAGDVALRTKLEVEIGPARHPFLPRGGFATGEPRWLQIERLRDEDARVFSDRIEVAVGPHYEPGETVEGGIVLHLAEPTRARALRLVLRTTSTTALSIVPWTLMEREAVVEGFAWEGHLASLGLAVKKVLHMEDSRELVTLPRGVTRWAFRFPLDPQHPVRVREEVSVLSEVIAYVAVPAAPDYLRARSLLHVAPHKGSR